MHPLFERYQRFWEISFWVGQAVVGVIVNATSVIMEYARRGDPLPSWAPFVWEGSSYLMQLILLLPVIYVDKRWPIRPGHLRLHLAYHLLLSVAYCLLHVGGMVLMRKVVYSLVGQHYDFGDWSVEMIYEYRKDLLGYISILLIINCYRYIVSQLRGEAKLIAEGEDTPAQTYPERLLVKKLGKEFIVKVQDIDWIEASGNYMNLHLNERIYPLRETMAGLEQLLDGKHFVRVHRSIIVNLDRIREIQSLDSGDYKIILHNNVELNFSRRYRERLNHLLT